MHVIIANGPPFSGKDTLVNKLLEIFPDAIWMRFKNVLYKETWKDLFINEDGTAEITLDEWIEICNDVVLKDMPLPWDLSRREILAWKGCPEVYGNKIYCKTPRKHLIDKSEDDIKVEHGEGGVAVITAGYIKEIPDYQNKLILFSDGGFNCEIGVLKEELGLTDDEITVVRLEADGCNFDNDSREFIENPKFTLFNDKTDNFYKEMYPVIKHICKTPISQFCGALPHIVEYTLKKYIPDGDTLVVNKTQSNTYSYADAVNLEKDLKGKDTEAIVFLSGNNKIVIENDDNFTTMKCYPLYNGENL